MPKKKKEEIIEVEVIEKDEPKEEVKNKKNETNNMPITIIMGVIGLILVLLPEESNKLIGYIVGGALLAAGIISVMKYFKEESHLSSLGLISGILYVILGLIIVLNPLSIMKLATMILGVYLIVNGALKMHAAYLVKSVTDGAWQSPFIAGVVIIIFGIVLILDPFSGLAITKIAGAFLLIVAIYDIINQYILNK